MQFILNYQAIRIALTREAFCIQLFYRVFTICQQNVLRIESVFGVVAVTVSRLY